MLVKGMARLALFAFLIFFAGASFAESNKGEYSVIYNGNIYKIINITVFSDYPGEKISKKIAKDIDWSSHPHAKAFRTRLRAGLKKGPNFNGHYAVIHFGCGTSCQVNWVVDTTNGKVIGGFGTTWGAKYNINSGLIMANAVPSDIDISDIGNYLTKIKFYKIENQKLKEIKTVDIWDEIGVDKETLE